MNAIWIVTGESGTYTDENENTWNVCACASEATAARIKEQCQAEAAEIGKLSWACRQNVIGKSDPAACHTSEAGIKYRIECLEVRA